MGEPAVPSAAERHERLVLAKAIVDAVRNDEPGPLEAPWMRLAAGPLASEMTAWCERVDLVLFSFAQEIEQLTEERDVLCARFEQLEASRARSAPVVAAACDVALALHAGDAHCAAGDHDNCTTWREAKRVFDEAVAAYLEPDHDH